MFSENTSCSQSNAISMLSKQFHQDRSLQKDYINFGGQAGSSKGFRSLTKTGPDRVEFQEQEFMQHEPASSDWAMDFVQYQPNDCLSQVIQGKYYEDWHRDFQNYSNAILTQKERIMFEERFNNVQKVNTAWETEFFLREVFVQQEINNNEYMLLDSVNTKLENLRLDTEAKKLTPEQKGTIRHQMAGLEYDAYEFNPSNIFLQHPELIDSRHSRGLPDSILVLEANTQKQIFDPNAWKLLGFKQQENENDLKAISALRQAVKMDPSLTDAWLALAVSYSNEKFKVDACDALESWVTNNKKYAHQIKNHENKWTDQETRLKQITNVFIDIARKAPGVEMDPEIQVCLGVLFNLSQEYNKAVDCFNSALISKPGDYLLWNKLGATLANSKNSDSAIDAYLNALEINPNYIRARYNLAISFMNLSRLNDAVIHLLTSLELQQSLERDEFSDGALSQETSNSIWKTLRMILLA